MKSAKVYPIVLAAGPSPRLDLTKPPEQLGGKSAFEVALENCAGLHEPIVVLGCRAPLLRRYVPRGARIVVNQKWRSGQLSSLLAGLRRVPRGAAFMLYPLDQIFLTKPLVHRIVRAFTERKKHHQIVMPRYKGQAGHPVIFSAAIRKELYHAQTAREVVYREPRRILYFAARTPAIWKEFDSPASYRRFQREVRSRKNWKRLLEPPLPRGARAREAPGHPAQSRDHQA
ncbi:MAG: NTP transferase domain-containing protein [Candidatus Acidiferrales bacterium]